MELSVARMVKPKSYRELFVCMLIKYINAAHGRDPAPKSPNGGVEAVKSVEGVQGWPNG